MDGTVELLCKIFLGLIGLCVGSFLNVLIYRLPLGINLASPPSHCPQCNAKIKWYDNIPLLSYLILGGKCRNCKKKIPFRYFAVELGNVLLWIAVLILFDLSVYAVVYALLASALLAIVFIDAEHGIIPDSLNLFIAGLGVVVTVYSIFYPEIAGMVGTYAVAWWEYLVGGAGAMLLYLAVYGLYKLIRKREGLGGGDIKLMGALGLVLGYRSVLLCIGLSAVLACIYLAVLAAKRKLKAEKPFAFGPFIAAAAYLCALFGNCLIGLYLGLF